MKLNLFNLYTHSLNAATDLKVVCFNDLVAFQNGDMNKAIFKFPYPKDETEKYGVYPITAFYFTHFRNKKTASVIALYNSDFIIKDDKLYVETSEET